jgi:hypothetical protein
MRQLNWKLLFKFANWTPCPKHRPWSFVWDQICQTIIQLYNYCDTIRITYLKQANNGMFGLLAIGNKINNNYKNIMGPFDIQRLKVNVLDKPWMATHIHSLMQKNFFNENFPKQEHHFGA